MYLHIHFSLFKNFLNIYYTLNSLNILLSYVSLFLIAWIDFSSKKQIIETLDKQIIR